MYYCVQDLGDFMETGYLSPQQAAWARTAVRQLLAAVRPDAVALVDSFKFSDRLLGSALGRYDGRVYETLWEWAQREPLNRSPVADGYRQFLRPLIHAKL